MKLEEIRAREKEQSDPDRKTLLHYLDTVAGIAVEALGIANQQTCRHEEVHRGGTIWTICSGCGAKWADDRGGFQPSKTAKEIDQLDAELALIMKGVQLD